MLHDDIETPLVRVLAKMEVAGIGVDRAELQTIADSLKESAATLQDEVQELAGHEFNVNSTPQLRTVLYDELGLTPGKKTKTGFSTDAQTLESLRGAHPIIEALLVVPRGGEAALDLRREPAGRGGRRRPHPRVVRPDGGAHGPHLVGPAQPAQHPGAHRPRQAVPPRLRARRRAAPSWWPTTTRWSCAASPTSRRTPA